MKRTCSLLLVLLAFTAPAFARVLSYAPYTDRSARVGVHERNTRYFPVIEGNANAWRDDRVILYDSSGADEPRAVYPADGGSEILFTALYESSPQAPPMLLVGAEHGTMFSADGGVTWKVAIDDEPYLMTPYGNDFGGPFVQGLGAQVLPGNDAWPFVFAQYDAIVAISASGTAKTLASGGLTRLVGRNAAGDQFLIHHKGLVHKIDLASGAKTVVEKADHTAINYGWITDDGSVYLLAQRWERSELTFHQNGEVRFRLGSPTDWSRRFFAVPTHDFNGAWMLDRASWLPTTLYRHTRFGTFAMMWSDFSGPEVEALIAGESGQTLLVQAHRPRDGATYLQRPIIDPALAVWHVGDPEPDHYDELYLREESTKGFVHVDVDALESGAPFVFNSGFFELVPDVIISPVPPAGGGDVIQEWGLVRASLKQRLVLPGVARLPGAHGSFWLTDVTLYNPFDAPQDVGVHYTAVGERDETELRSAKTITLAPREIRVVRDALKSLFDIENGGGALTFTPAEGINVTSRTYTRTETGGTFGFGMPAIDWYNAASPNFPVTFAGAFPGPDFRTNLLITDTSGKGTSVDLSTHGVSGFISASDDVIEAPANGIAQLNDLRIPLALHSNDTGGLIVRPSRGTAIASVIAIDNLTNDATYFPPDLVTSGSRLIPVIGHVDGANATRYRTDLYLYNPSTYYSSVYLEATDFVSRQKSYKRVDVAASGAVVIEDALWTLFGKTGLASLRYETYSAHGVRVTSRSYTVAENGGTYGCLVPPLNSFQMAPQGDRLEILGIYGGRDFRVNLGLVELSRSAAGNPTRARISILDQSSNVIDTFVQSIPAAGGIQINDIFATRNIATPLAAMITVDVLDVGVIGAYATLTDNRTNDSTYLGAQLGATPK